MANPYFRVTMLPAAHGDGIWVEYSGGGQARRLVIDGGPINAYPDFEQSFDRLPDGDKQVDLFVISHVDTDHIEAPVRMLAQLRRRWPFVPGEIWFNGYRHMTAQQDLGARDGEFLSALINREAGNQWNASFEHHAVVVPDAGALPRITFPDDMVLTLLSPGRDDLEKMAKAWEAELKAFSPGDLKRALEFLADDRRYRGALGTLGPEDLDAPLRKQLKGADPSKANGSSIAFLAEFQGTSILLLADAHMSTVCASLQRLLPAGQTRLKVDAVKLSHHGSKNNLTPRFLELVDAEHFLVSTNGDHHEHPDAPAIEAVIAGATRTPTLWFNYRSPYSEPWEAGSQGAGAKYATRYPAPGTAGITLTLI